MPDELDPEVEELRRGGRTVRLFKRSLSSYLKACAGEDIPIEEALRRARISAAAKVRAHEKGEEKRLARQSEKKQHVEDSGDMPSHTES